jgi:hypothetical protein
MPHQLKVSTFKVMKPFFLALKPSLTYTLIGLWCKLMYKMLLIVILKLLFLESYKMLKNLLWTLSLLLGCFMVFIFLFITNMGNMNKGFIVIKSSSGMRQGDPLNAPLFAFSHYWALVETIAWTPNFVFASLMDDNNIVGLMNEGCFYLWPPFNPLSPCLA